MEHAHSLAPAANGWFSWQHSNTDRTLAKHVLTAIDAKWHARQHLCCKFTAVLDTGLHAPWEFDSTAKIHQVRSPAKGRLT